MEATKIGTTYGLAVDTCGPGAPEQVYVRRYEDGRERAIQIDGWVGWSTDAVMNLTTNQARELIPLLVMAIVAGDNVPDADPVNALETARRLVVEDAARVAGNIIESATRQLEQVTARIDAVRKDVAAI